jgi:hypothetical protein
LPLFFRIFFSGGEEERGTRNKPAQKIRNGMLPCPLLLPFLAFHFGIFDVAQSVHTVIHLFLGFFHSSVCK